MFMSYLSKTPFLFVCVSVFLLAGCGNKEEKEPVAVQRPVKKAAAPEATDGAATPTQPPAPPEGTTAPAVSSAPTDGAAPVSNEPVTPEMISMALQRYVAGHMIPPQKVTEKDFQKLVDEKYLPSVPVAPPGKKYVWDNRLNVTLEKK